MSYLVLARKWRPQTFAEVVAQPHVVQALQNAIHLNRLPHAILLTGSRGVGKTTIARLIAKAVNCFSVQTSEGLIEPCNVCEMCQEIIAGRSVDIIEIDGASNRSIDDIRELRENVQYLPNKGRRKVYIIDEVHMLTREAFNALLKTLEEPPPHVLFLFATTEAHKIPITILSRCQRFDFKRISLQHLRGHLDQIAKKENIHLSETALTMVARAAAGGMRDALSLLDQVIAFGGESPSDEEVAQAIGVIDRTMLLRIGKALFDRDPIGALRCLEELFSYAYDLRSFTHELAGFLRDLTVIKLCSDPGELVDLSEDELHSFQALIQEVEIERIQQCFRLLTQGAEEIAQSNHPKLLLEMTLIRMARTEPVRSFDSLFKRLTGLESFLARLHEGLPPAGSSPPTPLSTPLISTAPEARPSPPAPRPPDVGIASPISPTLRSQAKEPSSIRPSVRQASSPTADKQTPPEKNKAASPERPTPAGRPPPAEKPASLERPPLAEKPTSAGRPTPAETPAPTEKKPRLPQATASSSKPGSPLTIADWEGLVERFRASAPEPFFAGSLVQLGFSEQGGLITLRRPSSFHYSMQDLLARLPAFEDFLRSQGITRRIQLSEGGEDSDLSGEYESVQEVQDRRNSLLEKELAEEAHNHPGLQTILRHFPKGKIQKVHILREQAETSEDSTKEEKG